MTVIFTTAQECEAAFYNAFNAHDLDLMVNVWALHMPILCVHPGGSVLQGHDAIMSSWRQIFSAPDSLRLSISDQQVMEHGDLTVRFVHENIHHGAGMQLLSLVLATNVFIREGETWKLCSHHASSAPTQVNAPRQQGPQGTMH